MLKLPRVFKVNSIFIVSGSAPIKLKSVFFLFSFFNTFFTKPHNLSNFYGTFLLAYYICSEVRPPH